MATVPLAITGYKELQYPSFLILQYLLSQDLVNLFLISLQTSSPLLGIFGYLPHLSQLHQPLPLQLVQGLNQDACVRLLRFLMLFSCVHFLGCTSSSFLQCGHRRHLSIGGLLNSFLTKTLIKLDAMSSRRYL